ncbi:asparagine synthase (glutamine-hydrolyzing), partial [Thermodesulfobacteriota bacterium]
TENGHQPMSNEDDSIWIVFNGEIYDFLDHRKDLEKKGHILKSRTDSEIIIHFYEEYGINCLKHLNGMFAFALWDKNKERLWLVRDRVGIKPLHYYYNNKILVFGSEIKALLADPDIPKAIDSRALELYLTLNYIPAPHTIYRGIRKLEPGNYLLMEKGKISVEKYWDVSSSGALSNDHGGNISECARQLFRSVEEAVKRRLIADVPLGAFLSGGIDSSIIVALMARNSNSPVRTFSIGYRDIPNFDETGYAREVAEFNNTDHHEFKLESHDIISAFPEVLDTLDEPFADSSAIPTYIVSRETRNHVTVAMSGDGGDELFAGYRMYRGEKWARYFSLMPSFVNQNILAPAINLLPDSRDNKFLEFNRRLKKFFRGVSNSFPVRYKNWREVFPAQLRRDLLTHSEYNDLYLEEIDRIFRAKENLFKNDLINLMLYMDFTGLLHGDMLTKVDRMSMANSLEVRVPLLDHTVAEYAFKIKGNMKLRGKTGKFILIHAFKDLLPPALHKRPKAGFEIPLGVWFRKELKFLINEYLCEDRLRKHDLFKWPAIQSLIKNHMNNKQDTSWHLWNLIVFQHWYEKYM